MCNLEVSDQANAHTEGWEGVSCTKSAEAHWRTKQNKYPSLATSRRVGPSASSAMCVTGQVDLQDASLAIRTDIHSSSTWLILCHCSSSAEAASLTSLKQIPFISKIHVSLRPSKIAEKKLLQEKSMASQGRLRPRSLSYLQIIHTDFVADPSGWAV